MLRSVSVDLRAALAAAAGSSCCRTSEMCARSVMLTSVAKVPRRGKATTRRSYSSRLSASRTGVLPTCNEPASSSSLRGEPGGMSSMTMRSRISR